MTKEPRKKISFFKGKSARNPDVTVTQQRYTLADVAAARSSLARVQSRALSDRKHGPLEGERLIVAAWANLAIEEPKVKLSDVRTAYTKRVKHGSDG